MEQPKICEKGPEYPCGCGKCHQCGTELLDNNPRSGKEVDYCPQCQADRPYQSHGWLGMFTETKPCKEELCPTPS